MESSASNVDGTGISTVGSFHSIYKNKISDASTGISVPYSGRSINIYNNTISNVNEGIYMEGPIIAESVEDVIIANNSIFNVSSVGIELFGYCFGNNISGNLIPAIGSEVTGIAIYAHTTIEVKPSGNLVIRNNITGNGGYCTGIKLSNTQYNSVKANRLEKVWKGITDTYSTANMVANNSITLLEDGVGIEVSLCQELQAEGNIISDGFIGIQLTNTTRILLRDNLVQNLAKGMLLNFVSEDIVSENRIIGSTRTKEGIRVTNSDFVSLNRNNIRNSNVSISGLNLNEARIEGNAISNSRFMGISFNGGLSSQIVKNIITNSGESDLSIYSYTINPTDNLIVKSNTMRSGERGIWIKGNCTNLSLVENNISEKKYGIIGNYSNNETNVTSNVFAGNLYHAFFIRPQSTFYNNWDDVGDLRIYDSDADSYGDCGEDHPYTAKNYSGLATGAIGKSSKVVELVDYSPYVTKQYATPSIDVEVYPNKTVTVAWGVNLSKNPVQFNFTLNLADKGNGTSICYFNVTHDSLSGNNVSINRIIPTPTAGVYYVGYNAYEIGFHYVDLTCFGKNGPIAKCSTYKRTQLFILQYPGP